jgi:hypothetical protein
MPEDYRCDDDCGTLIEILSVRSKEFRGGGSSAARYEAVSPGR